MAIKVADEVWIVTALLHREQPYRQSFRVSEIVRRADQERLNGERRPGVQVHASLHCVANKAPNPATYRMLYATPDGGRRLFRQGDDSHPARNGKIVPERNDVPDAYRHLLDWYEREYSQQVPVVSPSKSLVESKAPPYQADEPAQMDAPRIMNGMDIQWQSRIVVEPAILTGKPLIKGTRLAVEFIVELLAQGWQTDEILKNYPGLSETDIRACLGYAAAALRAERVYPGILSS